MHHVSQVEPAQAPTQWRAPESLYPSLAADAGTIRCLGMSPQEQPFITNTEIINPKRVVEENTKSTHITTWTGDNIRRVAVLKVHGYALLQPRCTHEHRLSPDWIHIPAAPVSHHIHISEIESPTCLQRLPEIVRRVRGRLQVHLARGVPMHRGAPD
jgi:hypothetical protein